MNKRNIRRIKTGKIFGFEVKETFNMIDLNIIHKEIQDYLRNNHSIHSI